MFGPDKDPSEAPVLRLEQGDCRADLELLIEYGDGLGQASRRLVQFGGLYFRGEHTFIGGTCRLRKQYRAFRVDRLVTVAQPRTGELVDDVVGLFLTTGELITSEDVASRAGLCVSISFENRDE